MIVLPDSRIHTKQYGHRILHALPNGRKVTQFEAVKTFFAIQQQ
ncbi:hypothetical protein ACFLXQ_03685 [Chloroflexota bacterium]